MLFAARLQQIRATPSKSDGVRAVVRLQFEAADIDPRWLFLQLGETVQLDLSAYQPPALPIDQAIEEAMMRNGQLGVR
jgi:hypothetical protein